MFHVTDIVEAMCERTPKDRTFEPTDVQLSDSTASIRKTAEDATAERIGKMPNQRTNGRRV